MNYSDLLAAIQGILAAVSVWQAQRSYDLAIREYNETSARVRADPATQQAAARLAGVLPPEIAETFHDNVRQCWTAFNKCIRGKSNEDEFIKCESDNRNCICSNLRALVRSNGCLPAEFRD